MKTVRSALLHIVERSRSEIPPEMETLLFGQLGLLGKEKVVSLLQIWRPIALQLARTKSARERRNLIQQWAAEKPYWPLYATAAWTTRTVALAEYLERADLSALPKVWAEEQALLLMEDFEDNETWLWPFDSEPPWEEDDDNDEN